MVAKIFIIYLLFGRLLESAIISLLPNPWYLNTSASVNLQPGTTIIDTHSLKQPDYFVLTGRNGSNVVGLYRYKVDNNGWVGLNTTLGGIGWAFDIQRKWSTAAVTVNPWTRIPFIVYLHSKRLVFRQYPIIDTLFDSNSATGLASQFTLLRAVPRPHLVLHWADSSTLIIGIHSHSLPDDGLQINSILGHFHVNASNVTQEAIYIDQNLIFSMEFECSTCSVENVRVLLGNGTMGYLGKIGNQYSWTTDLKFFSVTSELSHKCYDYSRNWTHFYYRVADTSFDEWASYQKIHDPSTSTDFAAYEPPLVPRNAFQNQMALHCHDDRVMSACVTTSTIIKQENSWNNLMDSHAKGKSEIFLYTRRADDIGEVMVFSTPGNENVSRIYFDNSQFHIIGTTEGDIMDINVTIFSDKLFFAGFSRLAIVSAQSPEAVENQDPFEILPNRDFAIRFSSLPADTALMSFAKVTINKVPCESVRWFGYALYALALPALDINFDLVVEFYSYPHIPKVSTAVSLKRPSIINVVPSVTDIASFTTIIFTVLYMGQAEFSDTVIFIGNQKCEVQTGGAIPNYFSVTNFNCTVPFGTTGRKFIDFTSSGRKTRAKIHQSY